MKEGANFGRYTIRSKIGKGGMGEVFLAEDNELGRPVALKVLLDEVAANEGRVRRFILEARAASALNHPNILTIYEIGRTDRSRFIASEYVTGETLNKVLRNRGATMSEALSISIQIVSALQAAHEAGIVHRDIKPDNIMVRPDGIVKVLDFGLAKLTEKTTDEQIALDAAETTEINTMPGMILGTPQYMSPEQAGGRSVDHQTDIFSFGIILYEMLTGHLPFEGETQNEFLASILKSEPIPIEEIRPHLPPEICAIVNRALKKDRAERYRTASQLLEDLKQFHKKKEFDEELERTSQPNRDFQADTQVLHPETVDQELRLKTMERPGTITGRTRPPFWSFRKAAAAFILLVAAGLGYLMFFGGAGREPINSLAVLPFANEGGNADAEYLSDGLTESIIYNLSNLPQLKVLPTSTVFRYKGKDLKAETIAAELGVRAVLVSRITQRADQIEIRTELIDTLENKVLWGELYRRRVSDALEIQKDISREISERLRLKLTGAEEEKVTKDYTSNKEAYQAYLRGRFHWNRRNEENLKKGIEYFQKAIELDPGYALAWSGLADSYNVSSDYMNITRAEAASKARAAATRALDIDPELAEAHTSLAAVKHFHEWDFAGAIQEFQKSAELNPNYALTHNWYAQILGKTGRSTEAIREARRALELEPFTVNTNFRLGQQFYLAGQFEDAVRQHRRALEIDPNYVYSRADLVNSLTRLGKPSEAIAELEPLVEKETGNQYLLLSLGSAYVAAGKKAEAEGVLREMLKRQKDEKIRQYGIAVIYARLGQKEKAFEFLEKSLRDREDDITFLKVDPMLDLLRDDPRYADLVKRVGLP
ncbi:MAG: protein kinase [Pyrinomonadaceae bacterium]